MKRRVFITVLIVVCLLVVALGLVACDVTRENHTHTFSDNWTYNTTHHWHMATCGHITEISGEAEHIWVAGEILTEPTCVENGNQKYTCLCGKTKIEEIPATGHSFSEEWTGNGTYHWHSCSGCDETRRKAEHTFGEWTIVKEPQGEVDGLKKRVCSECKYEEEEAIHAHKFSIDWKYDATHHWHNATCEHTTEIIEYAEHTFEEWITERDPQGEIDGLKKRVCSECNYAEEEVIHAHKFSTDWKYDATHHWHNATCEHTTEIGEYSEHTFGEWITEREPQGEIDGLMKRVCSECKYEEEETIHFHKFSTEWTYDATYHWHAATCEHIGEISEKAMHDFVEGNCFCGISGTVGLEYKINSDGASYYVSSVGTLTDGNIIIGNIYNGMPVTRIGDDAFSGCDRLTSVTIPSSVKSIGNRAFYYCTKLNSVKIDNSVVEQRRVYMSGRSDSAIIPDNATSIGDNAFEGCRDLTDVIIPDGVTSIGDNAFKGCDSLTSVTIPSSVTSIGSNAFSGCYKLAEIYNLSSLNIEKGSADNGYVGYYAKVIHTSLGEESKISSTDDGYTFVEDEDGNVYLIGYNGNETELTLPNDHNGKSYSINDRAFESCSSLTSVTIPDSVISIGDNAFSGCPIENATIPALAIHSIRRSTLRTVVITSGESIDSYAFYNCSSLTSVTISDSVTSIGDFAFTFCDSLTSVTISNSVTSIGHGAFRSCNRLEYNVYNNACYLGNENNPYLAFIDWPNFEDCIIHSDTKIIAGGAFEDRGLISVTIPESVIYIGGMTFAACGVRDIYYTGDIASWLNIRMFESSLPVFSYNLYINGEKLTGELVIPDGVTSIGPCAFSGCSSITSVTIPDSVTSIGDNAFRGCDKLVEIYNLSSLNIVKGSEDNGYIGYYAKAIHTSLDEESSIDIIEDGYMFVEDEDGNVYLIGYNGTDTELTLPDKYNDKNYEIYQYAFYNCSSLTSVTIGSGVTSIGESAFYDCRGLTSVTIGNSVTNIGSSAFSGCYRLVEIYNLSSLNIEKGSYSNGDVGYYAKVIHTSSDEESKIISTEDGYMFVEDEDGDVYLIGYNGNGNETELMLPNYYNGKSYSINDRAFKDCSDLTSVTIPDSVTDIGSSAFDSCSSLTDIYYTGDIESWCYISGLINLMSSSRTLYINGEELTGDLVIPDGVTSIGAYAFAYCSGLISVTIPNSVTSIGASAFRGCSGLYAITIPFVGEALVDTSKTHFGYIFGAWDYLNNSDYVPTSLKEVIITGGTSISSYAFCYCRSLTSVTIPDSVTSIGSSAFYYCYKLAEIYNLSSLNIEKGSSSNGYIGYYAKVIHTSLEEESGIDIIEDGYMFVEDEDGNVYFVGYSGNETELTLPNDYNGKSYSINDYAFYNCSSLTNVTIGSGVTSIGESAFRGCSSLTSVTIPDSVTSIGAYAFNGCSSLTSVTIGNNVTSIGYYAFNGCSSLMSVTIGNSVTSIGNYAFAYCSGLISVTIGNSVTSIGNYAFAYCSGLISVTIPNNVTSIGNYAFNGCSSLTSVTIPDSVMSIDSSAFSGCNNLEYNTYDNANYLGNDNNPYLVLIKATDTNITSCDIHNDTKIIMERAFYNCSGLMSVTIPDSVIIIGWSAFRDCSSLMRIIIPFVGATLDGTSNTHFGYIFGASYYSDNSRYLPTSLKEVIITGGTGIESHAFRYCSNLTSVTIPNSITSIGYNAFYGCSSLIRITIPFVGATLDGTKNTHFGYIFGASTYSDNSKYVPTSLKEVIITGGTSIGNSAFSGCSSLTSVTIPNSVTSIGNYAFHDCDSLEYNTYDNANYLGNNNNPYLVLIKVTDTDIISCNINNDTIFIYSEAFRDCSNLTSVTIPDSVMSIGSSAFSGCPIESATIPTLAISFIKNSNLKTVVITSGESISAFAFYYCSSLTSVIIPDGVTSIGDMAFYNCSSLTNVTIGSGVTSIGSSAFSGCPIENATIPALAISFIKNSNLKTVVITSGEIINAYAFSGCSSLTSITIPDGVTGIGSSAFSNCSSLTNIYYTGDIASWCGISGLSNLMSSSRTLYISREEITGELVIPDSVTSIGDSAFSGCNSLTSVIIPNSVTSIDGHAFFNCSSLTSVTIPNSVTRIGEYTFFNCSSLTSVIIPDGVTSIGDMAFSNCSSLTNVTIGSGVTSIGSSAFSNCSSLTNIYYTGDIASWCGISGLSNLMSSSRTLYISREEITGELVIPDSVTSIGDSAFSGCNSLTSVIIPNSVTSIDGNAFFNCSSLTSVTIPSSVTSIGSSAFYYCYKLVEVYNLSSLNIKKGSSSNGYIGYYAKVIHTSLDEESNISITEDGYMFVEDEDRNIYLIGYNGNKTELTLPNDHNGKSYSINDRAFENCSSLTSVTIPSSVTSIGNSAFYGCYKLSEVYNLSSLNIEKGSADNGYVGYYAKVIHTSLGEESKISSTDDGYTFVEDEDGNVYLIGYNGNEKELTLPNDHNGKSYSINDYAFYGCRGLTSVTIPDSATSIGYGAFIGCIGLISVTILDSVTSIGDCAFYNCIGLMSVTIGNGVTSIGNSAFSGCSSLTSVTVGNSVTSIGNYAFNNCSRLTSVTISDSVTSIGERAFSGCNLTSVTIGNSVTSIGNYAFRGCSNLTSVTIGNSVTNIGSYVFENCDQLTKVYYKGTSSEWSNISIGNSNSNLTTATRYYYSEVEPTDSGNYWHYAEDGVTVVEW